MTKTIKAFHRRSAALLSLRQYAKLWAAAPYEDPKRTAARSWMERKQMRPALANAVAIGTKGERGLDRLAQFIRSDQQSEMGE